MDILKDLDLKIKESLNYLKGQLAGIRGGRPTIKLVEDISVEYLNQRLAIKQLGSISIILPRDIQIVVWDKNATPAVLRAIESSNLNVNASIEGSAVRISLPPLSGERRQELIKIVKKEVEEAKIKIRSLRDDANKKIQKEFEEHRIAEDDKFKLKEQTQKSIDKVNEEIEKNLESKIREIEE